MASPACNIKDAAAAYVATTGGVNVGPTDVIVIQLASQVGVSSWSISCVYTDDLSVAATVTTALTIDNLNKTATYTAPAAGRTYIFQSRINGGIDINLAAQPLYTTTFGVYTLTSGGNRVIAANETIEGNASFGWVTSLNALIRAPGGAPSGTAGGDLAGTYPNPNVTKINGATVAAAGALTTGNGPYVSGVSALTYSALNLAGGTGWVSGVLPYASGGNGNAGGVTALAALNIDWSLTPGYVKALVSGASAITFSNQTAGSSIVLRLTGSASTVTWPAGTKWAGGVAPTQTATGTDVYTFFYDGTNVYGSAVQAFA